MTRTSRSALIAAAGVAVLGLAAIAIASVPRRVQLLGKSQSKQARVQALAGPNDVSAQQHWSWHSYIAA